MTSSNKNHFYQRDKRQQICCVFEASLVNIASYRTTKAMQRDPVSKQKELKGYQLIPFCCVPAMSSNLSQERTGNWQSFFLHSSKASNCPNALLPCLLITRAVC